MEYGPKIEQTGGMSLLPEKRTKPRINCDYPATVQGLNGRGEKFVEEARVINLSSSGALLVTKYSISNEAEVQLKVSLATGLPEWGTSTLVTSGTVVRNELQSEGAIGIAVKFQEYKFL
jgi:hypothetical protein